MGGGSRYPFPREVWSPAGGWWTRPSNWRANTAIASAGILFITFSVWNFSAAREQRTVPPIREIPSMMWAKQFKDGKMAVKDQEHAS